MEENIFLGSVLFIGIYAIATVTFVPGSILTIGAGFAFKFALVDLWKAVLVGTTVVIIGASIGDTGSFLLGRFFFREWVLKKSEKYPMLRAIQKAIRKEGMKLIFLLRLCPLIPYSILNYLMGITDIKFSHYLLGNLAMIPGTIVYVFIGTSISSIT
jgi:uncharacterized membrane protein YdjX (TVP38/TMEM64 family)